MGKVLVSALAGGRATLLSCRSSANVDERQASNSGKPVRSRKAVRSGKGLRGRSHGPASFASAALGV